MKISKGTLIAILILVVWLVLAWFLGSWLHLKGTTLWALRGGLAVLGIAGFVGYLLLRPKPSPAAGAGSAAAAGDLDFLFREASNRLRAANVAKAKNLAALPAIFVLGDSNTAKTTVISRAGLDAELLAGQAYQDNAVTPTRALNIWYARQVLFIDPAGGLMGDPGARRKLFHKFSPAGVGSVMGGGAAPSRAVVVTLDCDAFVQQGNAEAMAAKGRQLQAVLGELAQELGTSFPVYVLFTKADRLPYFREYVETLTAPEAAQILGVTLPLEAAPAGVYAEEQARRLTDAFQTLYYSLSDRRTTFLAREHDAAKLPNIYEFPREFGKLRPLLVPFLVDLCRPSQLRTNPFLRGFYFTGVRPVEVSDLTPAAMQQVQPEQPMDAGATQVFLRRQTGAPLAETPQSASRRVPQWVFLTHLFGGLLLNDKAALGVTQSSVKVSFWRRALMATAAALALLCGIWWTVSYFGNHSIVSDAVDAAQAVPPTGLPSTQLASLSDLQRLEQVRMTLARLNDYERDGAPWHLRLGLYSGNSVREPLRQVYYALFRRVLLAPTQDTMTALCASPPQSNDIANFRLVYDALKAYLITTSHHEKSTRDFLSPVLMQHWLNGRPIDNERLNLAQKQFDFYADDLVESNPYPRYANPNENAVSTARLYLNKFGYEQRVYQVMLADAAKQNPAIVFNQMFPGAAAVVSNGYRVEGAFTKGGALAFQKELQDPDKYFNGEAWVLGPASAIPQDKAALAQALQKLYQDDFVNAWRSYIKATSVAGYRSLQDAANKLAMLASNQSPLLEVLCVASQNTSVNQKQLSDLFQPPQMVTPPGCQDKLASPANGQYMDGLIHLQTSLAQVAANQSNDGARTQAINDATQAQATALTIARNFPIDKDGGVDTKTAEILQDPIRSVLALLQGVPKGEANGASKGLCAQLQPVLAKYPFNRKSTVDATLPEVTGILKQPDGALWAFYNANLVKLMMKQGDQYVRIPGQNMMVTDRFLNFFNQASHLSDALFRNGAQQPGFTFSIKPAPSDDVESVTLNLDGQAAKYPKGGGTAQQFTWPGVAPQVQVQVQFVGGTTFNFPSGAGGLWAVFHWLDTGEQWQQQGSTYTFETTLRTSGGVATIPSNGHPATVKFMLDPMGSPVRPGALSNLTCVASAVQ